MSRDEVMKQKRNLPLLVSREACSGKTYIVTGANVGLGLEAARHLAAVGAGKVILAVRNAGAGAAAKADIDATTGVAPNVVEVWSLDLSSYASVKAFAKRAEAELERIDGLIENAAIAPSKRELAEGHVLAMTVNVLSTFLLAVLMIPVMKAKAAKVGGEMPTISIVASRVSFDYKEAWDKIKDDPIVGMDDEGFETLITYPTTKLMEIYAVKHLAGTLLPVEKAGVIINVLCPGLCTTELVRNMPEEQYNAVRELQRLCGRTAEDGSRTLLQAVMAGKESHGRLQHSCEDGEKDVPSWAAEDKEAHKRTWDVIAAELEAVEPGCVARILQ